MKTTVVDITPTWNEVVGTIADAVSESKSPAARRRTLDRYRRTLEHFGKVVEATRVRPPNGVPWFDRPSQHLIETVDNDSEAILEIANAVDRFVERNGA